MVTNKKFINYLQDTISKEAWAIFLENKELVLDHSLGSFMLEIPCHKPVNYLEDSDVKVYEIWNGFPIGVYVVQENGKGYWSGGW